MQNINLFFLYFLIVSYYIMHSHVYYFRNFSPSTYLIAGTFDFALLALRKLYFKHYISEKEIKTALISFLLACFFGLLWGIRKSFIYKKKDIESIDYSHEMLNFDNIDLKKNDILDLSSIGKSNDNENTLSEEEVLGLKIKIADDHLKIEQIREKVLRQEQVLNEKLDAIRIEMEKYQEKIKSFQILNKSPEEDLKQAIHVIATQNAGIQEKVMELKKKTEQIDYLEEKLNIVESKVDTNIDEVQDFVNKITDLIEVIDTGIKNKHLLE